ncbi:MAG: hypothetical protein WDO24_16480 [Pseudomonadota bacterium]
MDGVLKIEDGVGHEGRGPMDEFPRELAELLDDPITHRVMASDKVEMTSLLALLRAARDRLQNVAPVSRVTDRAVKSGLI